MVPNETFKYKNIPYYRYSKNKNDIVYTFLLLKYEIGISTALKSIIKYFETKLSLQAYQKSCCIRLLKIFFKI